MLFLRKFTTFFKKKKYCFKESKLFLDVFWRRCIFWVFLKKLFICAFVRKCTVLCTVFFKKVCSVFLKKLFFCVFCSVLFFVCVLKKNYSFVRKLYCLKKGPYSVFLKIVDCDLCFFRESATFFGRKCTLFFCLFLYWLKCLTPPHLQWPVWSPANSIGNDLRLALTYPDYPIHIPTLTLRRITTALAARQGKGIPVTLGLNTDRIRGFNIFIVVPYVPILIVNNAIVFLSHVNMIRIRAS